MSATASGTGTAVAVAGAVEPSQPGIVAALRRWRRAWTARALIADAVAVLPLTAVLLLVAQVLPAAARPAALLAIALAGLGLPLRVAIRRWRALTPAALAARADALRPELEDSGALALAADAEPGGLAALQQARIRPRLAAALADPAAAGLLPGWPWRSWQRAWAGAALLALAVRALPVLVAWLPAPDAAQAATAEAAPAAGGSAGPAAPAALPYGLEVTITPRAYTGEPAQTTAGPDLRAPAGSRLALVVTPTPPVRRVAIRLDDAAPIPLQADADGHHRTTLTLLAPALARIELDDDSAGARARRPHRFDALADTPPVVRLIEPESALTEVGTAPADWPLRFSADDDHGLGPAELVITHAHGAGDQVQFDERRLPIEGRPPAAVPGTEQAPATGAAPRRLDYRTTLHPAALGFAEGDDLVVRLEVLDRRSPMPQRARSGSALLRWPVPPPPLGEGLDGAVQKVAPAAFRSQRQIILDAEALLARRPTLDAERYADAADRLGVDQKLLRLRYGEFLGEEFESGAAHTHADGSGGDPDHGRDHDSGHAAHPDHDHDHESEHEQDAGQAHAHDVAPDAPRSAFGVAGDVVAEYGHLHNESEFATLMDPETKRLLRAALAEMWDAELALRQAAPEAALPPAYRALALIKQVQQAQRILLARTALELPPFDASRRLGGERGVLGDHRIAALPHDDAEAALRPLAAALAGAGPLPSLAALDDWLRAKPEAPNRIGLQAEADALRRDPDCRRCRQALAEALWAVLPAPAAIVEARPQDALDAAWREALPR